jgi:KaiC/GvpD/RAD55 family RecA-like ATPase
MANVLIDGLKERISKAIKINQSVGILLPGNNYQDLIQAMFERIHSNPGEAWVYVTVSKPFQNLVGQYEFLETDSNIKIIDSISRAAGITRESQNCIYIESPTLLEKLGLEIMNVFKGVDDNTQKFLVIDSLSNLIIYNNSALVTEFFYHMLNKTRARDIHLISLALEDEGMDSQINRLIYLNDKIIKVRDSFI